MWHFKDLIYIAHDSRQNLYPCRVVTGNLSGVRNVADVDSCRHP